MANTPIAMFIFASPPVAPVLKIFDVENANSVVEESVTLTADGFARYLWRGTITGSLTGNKYCHLTNADNPYNPADTPHWIHDLTDTTELQFVRNDPPGPIVDLSANAISNLTNGVKADPPAVDLSSAALAAIGNLDGTGIGFGNEDEPALSTNLECWQGETITQSVTAFQSDGETLLDLEALATEFVLVFESVVGTTIAEIAHSQLTVSEAVFSFDYPAAVTKQHGKKIWSLRDATDKSKYRLGGTLNVKRAAVKTSTQ